MLLKSDSFCDITVCKVLENGCFPSINIVIYEVSLVEDIADRFIYCFNSYTMELSDAQVYMSGQFEPTS